MTPRPIAFGAYLVRVALALAALHLGSALAARVSSGVQQAPNSHIAMELSEAFTPSDRFSGFVEPRSGASLVVVEMPARAWDDVRRLADNPQALASRGIIDVKTLTLPDRTGDYVYVIGRQKTPIGDVMKFMLILREGGLTAMITANVPVHAFETGTVSAEDIEKALSTATVKGEMAKAPDLFRLGYLGPFKEGITLMGSSKGYNLSGEMPQPGRQTRLEPLFIIAPSLDSAPVTALEDTARRSFDSVADFDGKTVTGSREVSIAGLKGYEIIGEGVDRRSGEAAGIYLVLLAGAEGGHFIMAGTALQPDMQTYLPEFKKIAASFELVSKE